jgi:orotate phosphoribosyltransferase
MQDFAGEIAKILFKTNAIRFGEFTLTSGIKSPIYVDLRRIPSYPSYFKRIVGMMDEAAKRISEKYDCIVGVATAGIVWGSVLAYIQGKPFAYARGKRKEHGMARLVEGIVEGYKVLLVDDVATTGSSLAAAARAVIDSGGVPVAAMVIVDREQGAREALSSLGIELYRLATLREILEAAARQGLIDRDTVNKVLSSLYSEEAR